MYRKNIHNIFGTMECDPSAVNPNPQIVTGNASAYCSDENNSVPDTGGGDNQNNPSGVTLTSVLSSGHGYGDYALELTAIDGTSNRNRHYFTIVSGQVYEYRVSYRMTVGTSGRWRWNLGFTTSELTDFSNTGWVEQIGEVTANATLAQLEVYAALSGSASDKVEYKISLKLKDD